MCRRLICLLFHKFHFYGDFKAFYCNIVKLSVIFVKVIGVSGIRGHFFNIAVESWQSTYILQPCSVKSDTVTPSFYFIFNVLGLINNYAKFQQILVTTSFSMESP